MPGHPVAVSDVPLRWRALVSLLGRVPQGALSRVAGRAADLAVPRPLRGPVIGGFARIAGIDVDEAEAAPSTYPSVGAFFVRRLRAGARSWPDDPHTPSSPVDGIVGELGRISEGRALQAKGVAYGVEELLGAEEEALPFRNGCFATIYLSPRHYHRIHAPVSGRIVRARAMPGRLLPVNRYAVRMVPDLFRLNERLVVHIDSVSGAVAVVAIGATNVGRISAAFDPSWNGSGRPGVTNRRGRTSPEVRRYEPGLAVARGEELGAFHLGSTVVILFEDAAPFHGAVKPEREIRLGDPLFTGPDDELTGP